jgi:hypothetical protein
MKSLYKQIQDLTFQIASEVDHGECFYDAEMLTDFMDSLTTLRDLSVDYYNACRREADEKSIIEGLINSLPDKRILHVCNFLAVKIPDNSGSFVVLKKREGIELNLSELEFYDQRKDYGHHYNEMSGKNILLDPSLLNRAGRIIMSSFL